MTGVTDIRTASELAECGACEHRARKGGGGWVKTGWIRSRLSLCAMSPTLSGGVA